jgi:hypothetical protein
VILPIAYLPPTAWFASANQAVGVLHPSTEMSIEAHEHFQKGTIRNRCLIAGPNGIQTLSIPLRKGKNQQQPICDVRIADDEPWQRNHWRSIQAAYGSAPFFEHYAEVLQPFYTLKSEYLFEYNLQLIQCLLKAFRLPLELQLTEAYRGAVIDFPIDVPPYPQVFQDRFGYRSGLSALDILMCSGPNAFTR